MCLEIKKGDLRKTAEEDIACYKILATISSDSGEIVRFTPLREVLVDITKDFEAKGSEDYLEQALGEISVGFIHTFENLEDTILALCTFKAIMTMNEVNYSGLEIWKCVIPEGTKFYKGVFSDIKSSSSYASKKVKFIEKCV
jgi:hypothetical protein